MTKLLQKEEEFDGVELDGPHYTIALKQKLIKAFRNIDTRKMNNMQIGLESLREKLQKLKFLYENYRSLSKQNQEENPINVLSTIFLIKNHLKDFDAEYCQTKLFKNLNKKLEKFYEKQITIFKTKTLKEFYQLNFKRLFFNEITHILLERMKIEINQDHIKMTNFNYEKKSNEKDGFCFEKIEFENFNEKFPKDESDFDFFSLMIEKFFEIHFNNLHLFKKLKDNEDSELIKATFMRKILEFLKILNIKIFEKENRMKLALKIKELESFYNSYDYFNKEFYSYFENVQYDEIFERNKCELLEFKTDLCELLENIKNYPMQKQHYIDLNEKVKNQIESLEKKYHFKLDITKEQENNKLFFSFFFYFLLILELIQIFDEEIETKNQLFYNSLISILNLTQNGLNKLCEFFLNLNNVKEQSFLNAIFNLNKIIINIESNFLNKLNFQAESH